MTNISISNLKANPAKAIDEAEDFPVEILKRNKVVAYLVGKVLFEKLVSLIENNIDKKAVATTNFKKGRNFEDVAKELGL